MFRLIKRFLNRKSSLRVLAMTTLIAVVMSAFSGIPFNILAGASEWSGGTSKPTKGAGTFEDPYLIETAEQLAYVVKNGGGNGVNYRLENDIYVNDITKINWATGETTEGYVPKSWYKGSEVTNFNASIDGNGYKVYGIYYKDTSDPDAAVGLIPNLSTNGETVQITNLGIESAYIETAGYAAAFVSKANWSNTVAISKCYAAENVTLKGNCSAVFYGWGGGNLNIDSCYTMATVTGNVYGFMGDTWGGNKFIQNTYIVGTKITSKFANGATCANVYSTDTTGGEGAICISKENMQGNDVLENSEKMLLLAQSNSFVATNGYPQLKLFYKPEAEDEKYWNGTVAKPEKGSGEENDPYLIEKPEHLAYAISQDDNTVKEYYRLTSDLYLNDISKVNWETGTTIGGYIPKQWYKGTGANSSENQNDFNGVIDGDGHVIYGLYSTGGVNAGLVPETPLQAPNHEIAIRNLGIENAYISATQNAAAFVAYGHCWAGAALNVNISDCYAGRNVTIKSSNVAGVMYAFGGATLSIRNCYSLASATGVQAGFIGDNWGTKSVSDSYICNLQISGNPNNTVNCVYVYANNTTGGVGAYQISNANMQGQDVFTNADKMPELLSCDAFEATEEYPVLKIFSNGTIEPEGDYWNGTAKKPTKGDGTKENPYLIEKPEHLAYAVSRDDNNAEECYKLTTDIYLNDISMIDWATGKAKDGYTPNQWYRGTGANTSENANDFNGTIDGDGHTVYGLYSTGGVNAGLIPETPLQEPNHAVNIYNLGIENAYISAKQNAAAFIAYGHCWAGPSLAANIENSYVGENVTVISEGVAGAVYAFGGATLSIKACYSLGKINGETAGFVGDNWGTKFISDSYMRGTPISGNVNNSIPCENVYATDLSGGNGAYLTTEDKMQGLDVLSNNDKMPGLMFSDKFVPTDKYPILKVFASSVIDDDKPEGKIWSGKIAKKFATGKGTKEEPYIISNGAELAYAIVNKGFNGSYFRLSADIYLNDVTDIKWAERSDNNPWIYSNSFNGNLNGAGHIVYGIWYPENTKYDATGLIPVFNSGTVQNIGVRYSQIRALSNAGAIVGITGKDGNKRIDSCFSDETVTVKYTSEAYGGASGILGHAAYNLDKDICINISNCYSKAIISGNDSNRVNGIIGTAWQCSYRIKNCYSKNYPPYNANNEGCLSLLMGKKNISDIYSNLYTNARKANELEHFTYISNVEDMVGEHAKKSMSGLDFVSIFETVSSSTPKLRIFTSISGEEIDITGDTQTYSGGKGTSKEPFIISDAKQLRYLLQSENTKGRYYELSNDIYVNDVTNLNWKTNNPAGWYTSETSQMFEGYIDGKGYKIYGLFMNDRPADYNSIKEYIGIGTALFPKVSTTSVIRNIHIRNSYISGYAYAGSIVGIIDGSQNDLYAQVIGCSADETVTVKGEVAGGLVAGCTSRGLELYYSYFTGIVSATAPERENALVGDIWGTDWKMYQCYYTGYPAFRYSMKPQILLYSYGDVTMASVTYLTLKEMQGQVAVKNMKNFDWETVWYAVEGKTPQLKTISPQKQVKLFDNGIKGRVWSGYYAEKYASGNGTKEDPYIIDTPEQMARLVDYDWDNADKYYKITADLYLNDTSSKNWEDHAKEWFSGTHEFRGHLDGNGHVVYGMYFNTRYANAALFQYIGSGAVIEKLGVSHSTIINYGDASQGSFSAPFGAMVVYWTVENFVAPIINQCFADNTVSIEANSAGGIVGGASDGIIIKDCYFTGKLKSDSMVGQAIANIWRMSKTASISNSYFAGSGNYPLSDNVAASMIEISDVYHCGRRGMVSGAVSIATLMIRGDAAKQNMPKLDYDNVWMTVNNGTPVLRCFANAERFSDTTMPEKVEVTFSTQGGSVCESITGYPLYTELKVSELPIPTKYGYEFAGWYHFSGGFVAVEDGVFPGYNTVFFAKWIPKGFTVDFEGNLNSKYDYNSAAEHYKPGVAGYLPLYVKNGLKSMHTSLDGEKSMFLLSYENKLEVGEEYTMDLWIYNASDVKETKLSFIYANHPQVDSDIIASEKKSVENMEQKLWKKHTVTFVASSPYLLIGSDSEMYFDDIQLVPTGKQGKVLTADKKQDLKNNNILVTAAVSSVVILALASVMFILVYSKKRSNGKSKSE